MARQFTKIWLFIMCAALLFTGCGLVGVVPPIPEVNTERPPASHFQDDFTKQADKLGDELSDVLMDYLDHSLYTDDELAARCTTYKKAFLDNAEAALEAAAVGEAAIEDILKVLSRYVDVKIDGSIDLAIYSKPLYDKAGDADNLSMSDALGMLGDVRAMMQEQVNPLIERLDEVSSALNRTQETYTEALPASDYLYALMGDADRSYDFAEAFDFNF